MRRTGNVSAMSLAEVAELSLREKLQIMEAIWADLSARVGQFEIPPEHLELLDSRRTRVASGVSKLHDWDSVKHTIGEQ